MSIGDAKTLTITQLNMYVKSLLESSAYLNDISIVGEISNFTNHYKSGHFYLSLKDDGGLIRAVMFRGYASKVGFVPENGMKVVCRGKVSLYERDGQYQFYITSMEKHGMGDLSVQFEQLKEKLRLEGLFDEAKKRSLPKMPKKIAVITSPTGAAVQDVLNILKRRFPAITVIMCPVQVQGDLATPQMIEAIKQVNRKKCADVIIIGRGGGSIEDLWAFNDEMLARTVRASAVPVISAVGHETDFTICDFAADLRAPTPSASAELAVPEKGEVLKRLDNMSNILRRMLINIYSLKKAEFSAISQKPCLVTPMNMVDSKKMVLDSLDNRLNASYAATIAKSKQQFTALAAKINTLSPMNVLMRGYSAVFCDDNAVTKAAQLKKGDVVTIRFSDGTKDAVVKQ